MYKFIPVLITLLWVKSVYAAQYKPFFQLNSFSHSEPIAVHAIMNGWDAPFENGEVAFSLSQAEIGFGINEWSIGVLQRHDYVFEFSPSTAKLFYDTNNKNTLNVGDVYDLNLSSNSFVARGLKLGYQNQIDGFHWSVALSYLEGLELTDGSVYGQANVVSENDYDFNFDVDYYYNDDSLFDRKVERSPKGYGYGIDFGLQGEVLSHLYADLQIRDLFAQINWLDAPRTLATGSSQTKQYDDNGYLIFKPVASGVESNENFTQKIPTKIYLSTAYEIEDQHALIFNYQDYSVKSFYSLGYRFITEKQSQLAMLYNLTAQAWDLSYRNRWLSFNLIADRLPIDEAHTFGLSFGMHYNF